MQITIVTALFPPDIATPGTYCKELATRLKDRHNVTVIAYNHIPEEVPNVEMRVIEKNQAALARMFACTRMLFAQRKKTDLYYVQNGPSTELPMSIVSLVTKTPFILYVGDEAALARTQQSVFLRFIERIAFLRAHTIVTPSKDLLQNLQRTYGKKVTYAQQPLERPEIHPFNDYPHERMEAYETSWATHLHTLTNVFTIIYVS